MFVKKFLLVCLLLGSITCGAQNIKSEATFRLLKTANSLLEAQQFEAAEEYFKQGLGKAKLSKDY